QYFNVLSGRQREFDRFLIDNYIPQIDGSGLMRMVGSWHVAAGEGPYFILEGVAESMAGVNELLDQDDFQKLDHLLRFMIAGYKSKILSPRGEVSGVGLPVDGKCRFNHHYDLRSESREEYDRFLREVQAPTMARLGVEFIGGWYVGIGPGPNTVVEGSCVSVRRILEAIASDQYRRMIAELQAMVTCFGSKILVPSGHLT
ncbi:MAG: hypothetical protein KJ621_03670, partial [Proteobacteria bacterium]|nr:hypothetical protein [Pseudomonadota bacterium]